MNSYNEYCNFTGTTAIYPQHVAAEYLGLGLCSEAAECVEIVLCHNPNFNTQQIANAIGPELADCAWYTARLAHTYNLEFAAIVNDAKLAYRPNIKSLEDLLSEITVQAGLIAGKIKKQLRDGASWNGEQREEVRQDIRARLVKIVMLSMQITDWMYANYGTEYNSYDKLLKMNRKKLEGRKDRGTLSGSGDAR